MLYWSSHPYTDSHADPLPARFDSNTDPLSTDDMTVSVVKKIIVCIVFQPWKKTKFSIVRLYRLIRWHVLKWFLGFYYRYNNISFIISNRIRGLFYIRFFLFIRCFYFMILFLYDFNNVYIHDTSDNIRQCDDWLQSNNRFKIKVIVLYRAAQRVVAEAWKGEASTLLDLYLSWRRRKRRAIHLGFPRKGVCFGVIK